MVRSFSAANKPLLRRWFVGFKGWLKRPKTIRIKRLGLKIIITFCLALIFWPSPAKVIYGKPTNPPIHKVLMASRLAESPLQPVSTVEAIYIAPAPVAAPAAPTPVVVNGCGDNQYANFIYMHESGCNTGATNYLGCYGIGQDCNGIVYSLCGTDYACQNQYFTQYSQKYGGWYGSYLFWTSHNWW